MPKSYSIEMLPGEPILINTLYGSYNLEHDTDAHHQELFAILDNLEQPVYYIDDLRAMHAGAFQDFLVAFNKTSWGEGALLNHPNLIETIIVSTADLVKLSVQGLDSEIFGNVSVPIYDNLEAAIDHARMLIAQR